MLDQWLAGEAKTVFYQQALGRMPLSLPSAANIDVERARWQTLRSVVESGSELDAMIVRNGKLVTTAAPTSGSEALRLFALGCSLVLRRVERHDESLAELARDFEQRLGGSAVVQLYATPGGFFSFGWHYDVEDVFIVQTEGEKDYFLRQNTVNPRPTLEAMPRDMQYERETTPMMACTLLPGDWLYVPSGWWHKARAKKDSLSISVGVLGRTESRMGKH